MLVVVVVKSTTNRVAILFLVSPRNSLDIYCILTNKAKRLLHMARTKDKDGRSRVTKLTNLRVPNSENQPSSRLAPIAPSINAALTMVNGRYTEGRT